MVKAKIRCPNERIFFKNFLISRPRLPFKERIFKKDTSQIEVEILEVQGEKALVLLPNLMANERRNTAFVNIKYLD
jgi:hypothetical protein